LLRAQQIVVAHDLLRVLSQRWIVRNCKRADVAGYQRDAVLSTLSTAPTTANGKAIIWRVRGSARVIGHHGRIFDPRSFSVADEDGLARNGHGRRILSRRNEPAHQAAVHLPF